MDEYKLPLGFKKGVVKDAAYSVYRDGKSLKDWASEYLFFQEVIFPREKEYIGRMVSILKEDECRFEPYANPRLVEAIVEKLDGNV